MAVAAQYESAFQKLFPQGDYWDKEFADEGSDLSLFCKAKSLEFVRLRIRMNALKDESTVGKTEELIADWERVLLGAEYPSLDLNQRRLQLKSKQDVRLNKIELQKTAAVYGLTIRSITFPYRPAFFGHSRFNRRAGSFTAFSVLLFTIAKSNLFFECWQIAKPELEDKRFARMRFGIERVCHFPIYRRREVVFESLRKTSFGTGRLAIDAVFPLGINQILFALRQKLNAGRFSKTYFGRERLINFDGNSRRDLVSNQNFYENYINDILEKANFKFKFESAIANYVIVKRKLFSEFEAAVKAKLLANQIAYFRYTEV